MKNRPRTSQAALPVESGSKSNVSFWLSWSYDTIEKQNLDELIDL